MLRGAMDNTRTVACCDCRGTGQIERVDGGKPLPCSLCGGKGERQIITDRSGLAAKLANGLGVVLICEKHDPQIRIILRRKTRTVRYAVARVSLLGLDPRVEPLPGSLRLAGGEKLCFDWTIETVEEPI